MLKSRNLLNYPQKENETGSPAEAGGAWGQREAGRRSWQGGDHTSRSPPLRQCCIDLDRGVLRLKAPFSELPFLPLYQEPGSDHCLSQSLGQPGP